MLDVDDFVHEHDGRWVVAQKKDGVYYAPQRPAIRRLTGCTTTFGDLDYVAGDAHSYVRRHAAVQKAKELYDFTVDG